MEFEEVGSGEDEDYDERRVAGVVRRLQAGVESETAAAACAAEEVCVGGCEEEQREAHDVSEIGPGNGDVCEGAEGEAARGREGFRSDAGVGGG